ncbi:MULTISPECIES: hypothetical protein [Pantoea]|uniref:hypothetical protein n=1 Tax=Pantoea TaxID=53335 RepID=UPI00065FEA8A|nr:MULTISPECIES: hypothetical protein [Pantoea]MBS6435295.1 hypothetical protein [Pantoea sp.]
MINAKSPLRFLGAGFLNQSNKSLVINFFDKTGQFLSVLGIAHEKLAFTLPLISPGAGWIRKLRRISFIRSVIIL